MISRSPDFLEENVRNLPLVPEIYKCVCSLGFLVSVPSLKRILFMNKLKAGKAHSDISMQGRGGYSYGIVFENASNRFPPKMFFFFKLLQIIMRRQ